MDIDGTTLIVAAGIAGGLVFLASALKPGKKPEGTRPDGTEGSPVFLEPKLPENRRLIFKLDILNGLGRFIGGYMAMSRGVDDHRQSHNNSERRG